MYIITCHIPNRVPRVNLSQALIPLHESLRIESWFTILRRLLDLTVFSTNSLSRSLTFFFISRANLTSLNHFTSTTEVTRKSTPSPTMFPTLIASVALLSGTAFAVTGQRGDAAITTHNLLGASYQAVLPESNTTGIRGQITGTSNSNGTGVEFNINFYGFPNEASNGPFGMLLLLFSNTSLTLRPSLPYPLGTCAIRRKLHWHSWSP